MKNPLLLSLLLSLLLFGGCGGKVKSLNLGGARIPLADLLYFPKEMGAHQRFEIRRMGGGFQFDGYVEMEKDSLVIIGFTPMGSRAFSITLKEGQMTWDALPFYHLPVSPRAFLAAWQQAFLSDELLTRQMQGSKVRLDMETQGLRRFWKGSRLVSQVEYSQSDPWQGDLLVRQFLEGFSLKVETRSVDLF